MSRKNDRSLPSGPAIDSRGNTVIDPTINVIALTDALAKTAEMLRIADHKFVELQHAHVTAVADLRAGHEAMVGQLREGYQEKIARAESSRLDSIRQVDREEVAKTAVAANNAITLLASQTTELASTLDKKVSDTASAAELRNSAQYSDTNKRLSALELSSSEGKGKQTISDPQMEKLTELVATLASNQLKGSGEKEGGKAVWGYVAGGIGIAGMLMTLIGGVVAVVIFLRPASAPQVVYAPAPNIALPAPGK